MKNFVALSVLGFAVACGGGGKNVKPGGPEDMTPSWVAQGSGAFTGEGGKKLQGVGRSTNTDPKGRRQAADTGATRQLGQGIDALSSALAKMTESTKENVGDDISAIVKKAAAATQHVKDHWVSTDGTEQALDQVDVAALKQAVQSVDGDDGIKKEVGNNLDRAFEQIAQKQQ